MAPDLAPLLLTAASLGLIHTLLGPDHYLPFVALSKARGWTDARTAVITAACGAGHVMSSILIGTLGIAAGAAVEQLVHIEAWRGDIAAWLLLGFGLAYLTWGVKRASRGGTHSHLHVHADGTRHEHSHDHRLAPHVHPHGVATPRADRLTFTPVNRKTGRAVALATPWTLFVVFVFGPCEPLIPVLMYPAANSHWLAVAAVCVSFGLATIATMLVAVFGVRRGLNALGDRAQGLERWSHALAGATLTACAAAILFLGL